MDIKDLRGDDGSFSEDKVGDLINKFTDLKGKNEDLSTKVSQFDEQKNTIINDTKNSLLNIGDGMQLNVESFSAEDEVDNAFIALAKEAKVSQDVLERFKPALEKIKESSQEVYKGEEYLARVKQSKELGIGLNDKTLAYLTDEEYSQVVNLAQKSNGSSNAGNAGNNDIAPPMDEETAKKEFDKISQKSRRSLQDFTRQGELRKIFKPEDENI
jgi:hypothetical protein